MTASDKTIFVLTGTQFATFLVELDKAPTSGEILRLLSKRPDLWNRPKAEISNED